MPTTVRSFQDTHAVALDIRMPLSEWQGVYTHLEVWRSKLGEGGPFHPLFGDTWDEARVPSEGDDYDPNVAGALVNLTGKELLVRMDDEFTFSYLYTGPSPISLSSYANLLNTEQAYFMAFVDGTGRFVLRHETVGDDASLEVLPSDAAAIVGLPTALPASRAHGISPRIELMAGVVQVTFRDRDGADDYVYKTRYYNRFNQMVSEFSAPVTGGNRSAGLPREDMAVGFLKLVSGTGEPVQYARVRLAQVNQTTTRGEYFVGGDLQFQDKVTDVNGYVEFDMLRGEPYDVVLSGTDMIRRVTLPRHSSEGRFNLNSELISEKAAFSVQKITTIYADRRHL